MTFFYKNIYIIIELYYNNKDPQIKKLQYLFKIGYYIFNMLQKGKIHFDLFNLITRYKNRSTKLTSDNKNDDNLSTSDLKVAVPSLKDMEFSWSENHS